MADRIDAVTIVGGGIAGWLSAVMLDRFLNTGSDAPVRITVIESPSPDAPMAGEATLPSLPNLLRQLGISESEVFRRCHATFKLGVRYTGWDTDHRGKPLRYLVAHTAEPLCAGRPAALYHLAFGGGGPDFAQAALPASALIGMSRGPRTPADGEYGARAGYGYHLDPEAFAHLLWETAVQRGIEHVLADVAEVERDDAGNAAALRLADGGAVPVQLVFDTTGRIHRELGGAEVEAAPTPNDRVIAARMPAPRGAKKRPSMDVTALSAGWAWDFPLRNRIGAGYVFSAQHLSDEQARDELLALLGRGASEAGVQVRTLPARFGWLRRRWVGNCIALGPAAAAHEPLEATAVAGINRAVRWLMYYWPDRGDPGALRERYNGLMRQLDQEIADYTATHYRLSNRADTAYWQAVSGRVPVSAAHRANLDLWQTSLPGKDDVTRNALFQAGTYTMMLFGKGFYRGRALPKSRDLAERDWAEHRRKVEAAKAQMGRNLPDHDALLAATRGDRGQQVAGLTTLAGEQPAMP
ncbi:tryptophan halogenase [Limimonas halophila]|uniref:Tryptophan halogenase n=1 Tax=Limimonas halophila TaxID=1082479 RepID=A0A1G7P938_9PROT|nr:tryptophan 7-halogenase [Limimonas halophila]SDF82825.1 tryptophan halogenase [Limimonas halophila]